MTSPIRRRIEAITGPGPSQPSSSSWSREKTHACVAELVLRGLEQGRRRAAFGVEVAEPALPRAVPVHVAERVELEPVVTDVHLPVVGRDDERRVRRQLVEQATDELVGERELGSVVLVEQTELVRHAVDARVVRVDEWLLAPDQAPAVLHEHRDRAPTGEDAAAQVRFGEPGPAELALRDHGYRPAEERGVALHGERVRSLAAVGDLPAQDVEDGVVDPDAEPDDAVL